MGIIGSHVNLTSVRWEHQADRRNSLGLPDDTLVGRDFPTAMERDLCQSPGRTR